MGRKVAAFILLVGMVFFVRMQRGGNERNEDQ